MIRFIIYKYTNILEPSKVYIGQTRNSLRHRHKQHLRGSLTIDNKLRAHPELFTLEVIDECYCQEDADRLEINYIKEFGSYYKDSNYLGGYNETSGGGALSREAIIKMRASHMGDRNPNYKGACMTEEQRKNHSKFMSESNLGRKWLNNGVTRRYVKSEDVESFLIEHPDYHVGFEIVGRETPRPPIMRGEANPNYKGKATTKEQCAKHSADMTGRRWVSNGIERRLLKEEEVDNFLAENKDYHFGYKL